MSEQLHACLDRDAWVTALSDANAGGALWKSSDQLIVEGHRLPPGTTAFRDDVIDTATADFIAAPTQLVASTAKFPGYVCALMPLATRAFSRWLFAAVDWLDFWRH